MLVVKRMGKGCGCGQGYEVHVVSGYYIGECR